MRMNVGQPFTAVACLVAQSNAAAVAAVAAAAAAV
jgi:hypothetical protein